MERIDRDCLFRGRGGSLRWRRAYVEPEQRPRSETVASHIIPKFHSRAKSGRARTFVIWLAAFNNAPVVSSFLPSFVHSALTLMSDSVFVCPSVRPSVRPTEGMMFVLARTHTSSQIWKEEFDRRRSGIARLRFADGRTTDRITTVQLPPRRIEPDTYRWHRLQL